ncbi:MAG: 1-acyl-sn-glycerol-3-phosphate acyltransferase [Solirubrobacteraceae bacterium]|nr:1-acyl-sn-glycerol-3-phosphate acyltransferase [Solirubrobacteraceae bacterium]
MSAPQAPGPAEKLVKMKEQVYRDPRPKEYFDRFHTRTRTKYPDAMYEIVRVGVTLYSYSFFRLKVLRSEFVPQSGPVIIAPNHFSFMDHFFAGAGVRRKVQFMAKSQLFARPLQFVYTHGGVFPVRRGERDDDAFITAHTVLERDSTLCMYCEGGRSRTGDLAEKPKPGIGRLALESGAPVVPTAIFGSAKVRNWKRGQFPQVTVLYGEPLRFPRVLDPTREQSQAAAEEIFAEIKTLYGDLQEHGRAGIIARLRDEK